MADKEKLTQLLIRDGYLKTPLLAEAFRGIDRADFVPQEYRGEAYGNYPLPIGFGQTISQPLTVAFMLELLAPEPGDNVLEIGAGSGWQTALLAYTISQERGDQKSKIKNQNSGRVIAIERIPELKTMAEKNVGKYGFVKKGIAEIVLGDGSDPSTLFRAGEGKQFDKIIAAASAEMIPEAWKKQLKIGGRIVSPVGQSIVVIDKISEDKFEEQEYFGFSFVPLIKD